jgi:hypothetical protein
MTGFGSAIGKLMDFGLINSFDEVKNILGDISIDDPNIFFANILIKLEEIKISSKKIGNAQRMFFHYFFRELLNKESDAYLNLNSAVDLGFRKYLSQTA